eukprot:1519164-Rhodomonas_salina.1
MLPTKVPIEGYRAEGTEQAFHAMYPNFSKSFFGSDRSGFGWLFQWLRSSSSPSFGSCHQYLDLAARITQNSGLQAILNVSHVRCGHPAMSRAVTKR